MNAPALRAGLWNGLLGVVTFSFTIPATRVAVQSGLSPAFVGLGRALVAAVFALITLRIARAKFPERRHWWGITLVSAGCIVGFPWLTSIALREVPAAHGAVLTGLLPLATAFAARLRTSERPTVKFWICALLGSATVILYALHAGGGSLLTGDWFLLAAMAVAAIGYAEGGLLSRELGGWQTMCWSLLFSAPFILVPVVMGYPAQPASIPWQAWACFGYTSVFSIFLGMIWWYRGLALGGIARVGQVQLLQPFLTLLWSSVLLGEPGSWLAVACAAVVVALVAIGRR